MATATSFTGDTTAVCNTDVFSLHRRINRFMSELIKSQSSGLSATMSFDVIRAQRYLESLRAYMAWVVAQPQLDLPETGPQTISLLPNVSIPSMENESVYDLAILFELLRDELVNSQSARLSTGLLAFDHNRALAIVDKCEAFITAYIRASEPLDLPESSPMFANTGPGRSGV